MDIGLFLLTGSSPLKLALWELCYYRDDELICVFKPRKRQPEHIPFIFVWYISFITSSGDLGSVRMGDNSGIIIL